MASGVWIVCTICGKAKPEDDYPRSKTGRNGRRSQCKECVNRRQRAVRGGWRGPTGKAHLPVDRNRELGL